MGVVWAAASLGLLTSVDLLVVPLVKEAGGGTDANASIEICSAMIVVCNVSSWFLARCVWLCSNLSGCFSDAAACAVVVRAAMVGDAIGVAEPSVSVSGEVDTLLSLRFDTDAVSLKGTFVWVALLMACAGSPH